MQVSDSTNEMFRDKINTIQSDYTKEQATKIDNLLFDLYNLTDEERNTVGYIEIE